MVCKNPSSPLSHVNVLPGSGNSGGLVETQRGSGEDDGNYRHVGTSMGYLLRWADVIPDQSDKAHFADIVS